MDILWWVLGVSYVLTTGVIACYMLIQQQGYISVGWAIVMMLMGGIVLPTLILCVFIESFVSKVWNFNIIDMRKKVK